MRRKKIITYQTDPSHYSGSRYSFKLTVETDTNGYTRQESNDVMENVVHQIMVGMKDQFCLARMKVK